MSDESKFAILAAACLLPAGMFGYGLRRAVHQLAAQFPLTGRASRQPWEGVLIVVGWLMISFAGKWLADPSEQRVVTLFGIQTSCAISGGIVLLLIAIQCDSGQRPLREAGIFADHLVSQGLVGLAAFAAAVWPTALLLIVSQLWRSVETQHSYLQALREHPGGAFVIWIALAAVVAAPLAEELLFRVTLQGWLRERLSGPAAIGTTAAIFVLIHGWRDALPLLPLSLILGYVYDRTRSYFACVTTHALFNGANLALALATSDSQA